jgi:signal transduction histidine kinase
MIEKLSHTTRYEEIQNIIVNSLVSRLRLSGATFLDYSEFSAQQAYQAESCLGMDAKALEAINWSDLLPKIPQPYAVLTFDNLIENKILNLHEAKLFRKNSVQVLVKIDTRKRQPAILLLGNRRGDKELTSETLGIIKTIAKQASISLENAYLYRREAARERLAALGKVASIMIHEIKNPLGIIRVSNETLKKRYSKDATSFELATIIDDEISRMDQTIQKILNFAKPDPLALKSFDPKELIHDVTRKLRPEFEQASIELQFENNFNQSVLADSEKMRRILYNLLLNAKAAYKTTSSTDPTTPKRIVISTSNSQERFCLKIADNGEGIDEKTLHNIFQPFFTTNTGSTGLGLAIVQQIVSDHHGEILVNSKPGVGTSFEIYFPMNRSAIDFSSQFV